MKHVFMLLLCGMLSTYSIYAQNERYFAEKFIIGTSLTYIRNSYEYYTVFNEYTWNANIGISLSKRLFSGLQLLNVYTNEQHSKSINNHSIVGIFSQYDFFQFQDFRLFAELSLSTGNYSTSGFIPSKREGLYYLGVGIGLDYPLKFIKGLSLDLSFVTYEILNKIENKYSYTQYIVGLNYRIKVN
jgi:hypothetical protein